MADYIERQAAIDALGEEPIVWNEDDESELAELFEWRRCRGIIEAIPPAAVAPVKHGHWEERIVESEDDPCGLFRRRWYCSSCGEWQTYGKTDYCPMCGADMRGGESDG